jgi:hypothetical protein
MRTINLLFFILVIFSISTGKNQKAKKDKDYNLEKQIFIDQNEFEQAMSDQQKIIDDIPNKKEKKKGKTPLYYKRDVNKNFNDAQYNPPVYDEKTGQFFFFI